PDLPGEGASPFPGMKPPPASGESPVPPQSPGVSPYPSGCGTREREGGTPERSPDGSPGSPSAAAPGPLPPGRPAPSIRHPSLPSGDGAPPPVGIRISPAPSGGAAYANAYTVHFDWSSKSGYPRGIKPLPPAFSDPGCVLAPSARPRHESHRGPTGTHSSAPRFGSRSRCSRSGRENSTP